jgi:WD40 repeat protein
MKRYLILIAVLILGTSSLYSQKPMEDDPNVMWTYGTTSFSTYPSVLPNGNVLIGDGNKGDVIELNGLTGELIRRIPIPKSPDYSKYIELSQDGTRMIVEGCLIEYESGNVLRTDLQRLHISFLHPSNSKVIFNYENKSLRILDVNENSITDFNVLSQARSVTSMKVSNDGRFLAVGATDFEGEPHTHFYLYNAQTMELIHELEDVPAEGRTIEFIQFSENAKYVGYGQKTVGIPKATFFTCELPYKKWEVQTEKSKPYGSHGICFINNDYVYLSYIRGTPNNHSAIYDIINNKIIYETDLYHSYYPVFNPKYNNIVINGALALDFNKILNSVSVEEPKEPIQKFVTEYRKGILKITGFENISPNINLSINDLQGNIVFHNQVQIMNGRIEVTIPLPSGAYILRIQDGQNNFSSKFLVTN